MRNQIILVSYVTASRHDDSLPLKNGVSAFIESRVIVTSSSLTLNLLWFLQQQNRGYWGLISTLRGLVGSKHKTTRQRTELACPLSPTTLRSTMYLLEVLGRVLLQRIIGLVLYAALILLFALGTVLRAMPFMEIYVAKLFDTITGLPTAKEDYWSSLFGWEMLRTCFRMVDLNLSKTARAGSTAFNAPLVSLDGKQDFKLLDFARGDRPLVVNFGSCS